MSYPADSETLEHLHPLTTRLQVLIKTIHSIRTQKKIEEITYRVPKEPEPPSLYRLIASKNSFKEILDEKLKNETFRTEMTWTRRLQRMMCDVMGHPAVEFTIMGFILANTVVLALHHHEIDKQFKKVLDVLNLVLDYELLCHKTWIVLAPWNNNPSFLSNRLSSRSINPHKISFLHRTNLKCRLLSFYNIVTVPYLKVSIISWNAKYGLQRWVLHLKVTLNQ